MNTWTQKGSHFFLSVNQTILANLIYNVESQHVATFGSQLLGGERRDLRVSGSVLFFFLICVWLFKCFHLLKIHLAESLPFGWFSECVLHISIKSITQKLGLLNIKIRNCTLKCCLWAKRG